MDETFIYTPPNWLDPLPLDDMFPVERPLEVDLGCGKGHFLAETAKANPDRNFIGIDRLLRRLRKVTKKLKRADIDNARLLRIEGSYAVQYLLPTASVSTMYIFFPDPWPKKKHHRRRLFNSAFMDVLHKCMSAGGVVNVATDNAPYYEVIYELFRSDRRYEEVDTFVTPEDRRTEFEREFMEQGLTINRCSFATA